jgi:hypothetical protein
MRTPTHPRTAVPAPQQNMLSLSLWIFSQFLSATTLPIVELFVLGV